MTRVQARRWRHGIIVARKRRRRRRRQLAKREAYRIRQYLKSLNFDSDCFRLVAPRHFTLMYQEPRAEVVAFLSLLRRIVIEHRYIKKIYIDFTQTEKMISDGTLMLWAELYTLLNNRGNQTTILCSYPKDPIVEQVLQHVGIFELLGKKARTEVKDGTVTHWHKTTGRTVEGFKIADTIEIAATVAVETESSSYTTSNLYDGLVEAMNNCRHAYPNHNDEPPLEQRWWMFSTTLDDYLSVVFCDLGLGIPHTMRHHGKWEWEAVRSFIMGQGQKLTDAALIRAAFEYGATQTREPHRGKGLQDLKDVLENTGNSSLIVMSGRGVQQFNWPRNGEPPNDVIHNFREPIHGTLILWRLPIRNEHGDDKPKH